MLLAQLFKGGQRGHWTLLIDEALNVQTCIKRNLPNTHELLTRHVEVVDQTRPDFWRIAKKRGSTYLDRIARNAEKDDVWSELQEFAAAAISDEWHLMVGAPQYNALVTNKDVKGVVRQINASAFLMPTIVDGWRQVTVMSACFTETMMYLFWSRLKNAPVTFLDRTEKYDLRFTVHPNGDTLDIYCGLDTHFSKTIREKAAVTTWGSTTTVFAGLADAAKATINGEPYAVVVNNDINAGAYFPGAEQVPAYPHGLNTFQHLNHIVLLIALNPSPAHLSCLRQFADLTDDEITTAFYRLTVYQAAMRISLRAPNNRQPKSVFVPDADTAAWMQTMFSGSRLTSLDVFTDASKAALSGRAGRPRIHVSVGDKRRAQYERDKHRENVLAERDLRWKLVSGWGLDDNEPGRAVDLLEQMTEIKNIAVSPLKDPAHFHGTFFLADLQATEGEPLVDPAFDELAAMMRDMSRESHESKDSCWLWSPSHFIPETPNENPEKTRRGYINIAYCRHIILDNDGGDLTPEQFVAIFPGLRMITYSTWSSTAACPRWRALIETDTVVDIEGYKIIARRIIQILKQHGYHAASEIAAKPDVINGKGFQGTHGFDMGKLHPACILFMPSLGATPSAAFFNDHAGAQRRALPVRQWLKDAHIPPVTPVSVPATSPTLTAPNPNATPNMQKLQQAILDRRSTSIGTKKDEKVRDALNWWAYDGDQAGKRDANFMILSGRLKRAGCDEAEFKDLLRQAAASSGGGVALREKVGRLWRAVNR